MKRAAYHGGAFFEAIGTDFATLEKAKDVVNADVLDAWFDPSPLVIEKIKQHLSWILKTSPPIHSEGLVAAIAQARGVPQECILAGGGSSDVIFTVLMSGIMKEMTVLILDPMYGEYQHVLEHVIGAKVVRHHLRESEAFAVDTDEFCRRFEQERPSTIIIVNPNSPTGQLWKREDMLRMLARVPSSTRVVVDETYVDFAGRAESLENVAVEMKNLIIIKSMSKAYGLSGARVGYLVSDAMLVDFFRPFFPPWSVSLVAQIAAVEALKDEGYYQQKYRETHVLREQFMQYLRGLSLKLYPSTGSYFLAQITDQRVSAKKLSLDLRKEQIYIRDCRSMSLQFNDRYVRLAVRDDETNKRVALALKNAFAIGKREASR